MTITAHIYAQISALSHKNIQGRLLDKSRHELFFMARFCISACAVASAPLYFLWAGIPSLYEVAAFCCMMMPLISIAALSRTGRLAFAHSINAAGTIGFAFILTASGHMSPDFALAWSMMLPVEAALMIGKRGALLTGLCVLASLTILSLGDGLGIFVLNPAASAHPLLLAAPVMLYGLWLSLAGLRLMDVSKQENSSQAADYTALTQIIRDLIIRTDRTGSVLKASSNGLAQFNLELKDLSGRGLFERIHVADRPLYLKTLSDAVNMRQTSTAVLRLRSTGANIYDSNVVPVFRWVEISSHALPITEAEDSLSSLEIVSILRDITDQITRESEILAAREDSDIAAKWKDRFLANVSHELRTPLNAIIGFSDMLSNEQIAPKDPAKIREYASIICTSGQHLLEVVNTILDMSRIESGNYELDSEPFDLAKIIEQTCDMVRLKAEANGVTILRHLDARITEMTADKRAVKQILLNLVSNAVKFTPRDGRVEISTRPDGNHVLFIVSDNGIGISAPDLAKLGNPFFQVSREHNRSHEGTGLGLSVVRGLVGLYNGRISIDSAPGQGTTITVRLPVDRGAYPTQAPEPAKIEIIPHYQTAKIESFSHYAGSTSRITGRAS